MIGLREFRHVHTMLSHPRRDALFVKQRHMVFMNGFEYLRVQARHVAGGLQSIVRSGQVVPLWMPKTHRHTFESSIFWERHRPARQQRVKLVAVRTAPGEKLDDLDLAVDLLSLRHIQHGVVVASDRARLNGTRKHQKGQHSGTDAYKHENSCSRRPAIEEMIVQPIPAGANCAHTRCAFPGTKRDLTEVEYSQAHQRLHRFPLIYSKTHTVISQRARPGNTPMMRPFLGKSRCLAKRRLPISESSLVPPATIVGFSAHQCGGEPPVDLAEPACGCTAFCAASLSFTLAR